MRRITCQEFPSPMTCRDVAVKYYVATVQLGRSYNGAPPHSYIPLSHALFLLFCSSSSIARVAL